MDFLKVRSTLTESRLLRHKVIEEARLTKRESYWEMTKGFFN